MDTTWNIHTSVYLMRLFKNMTPILRLMIQFCSLLLYCPKLRLSRLTQCSIYTKYERRLCAKQGNKCTKVKNEFDFHIHWFSFFQLFSSKRKLGRHRNIPLNIRIMKLLLLDRLPSSCIKDFPNHVSLCSIYMTKYWYCRFLTFIELIPAVIDSRTGR